MATTGSSLIHHFSMKTQDTIKKNEHLDYGQYNKEWFCKKWGCVPDGNWFERKSRHLMKHLTSFYQRMKYGHTLIEKIEKGEGLVRQRLKRIGYNSENH